MTNPEDAVKPTCFTEEHRAFLNDMRLSGQTNMFGARPYLMDFFPELSKTEASNVLSYWMKTFS